MKTIIISITLLFITLSFNSMAKMKDICPEGFNKLPRTLVTYKAKKKVKGSKKHIENHFKKMNQIIRDEKIQTAIALAYIKEGEISYTLYSVENKEKTKEILLKDSSIKKKKFTIELQTWYQCM